MQATLKISSLHECQYLLVLQFLAVPVYIQHVATLPRLMLQSSVSRLTVQFSSDKTAEGAL